MKKYIIYILLFSFSLLLFSCNKEGENRWNVEIKNTEPVKITDISAAFYNDKIPFQNFKKDFGFFLSPQVPDATYEKKRADAIEKRVYKDALNKNNLANLEKQLAALFAHIKYYFPEFHRIV